MSLFKANQTYNIIENTICQTDIMFTDSLDEISIDKIINMSSNGLTLKNNILTNIVETIITASGITDVNTGNVISMARLCYLPTGLAALEEPPNPSTLHIQDTLLVDKTLDNVLDPNSTSINYDSIVLTDGTTTNTINKIGYTTKNTIENSTHYLSFNDNLATGISSIYKTSSLSCNPSTGTITATTFNISEVPATAFVASTFGQVGLVKIKTLTGTICGCLSTMDFNLTSCFNTSYRNYKIIISFNQVAITAYPSYALNAFLGTGTLPTVASLYGVEIKNNASSVVTPVYSANATTPLIFNVSSISNKQIIFDITNVGFLNTSSNQVTLYCKSEYNNLGEQGISDRTITTTSVCGCTITGLTLQQSIIGTGNNMNWSAVVFGYNLL